MSGFEDKPERTLKDSGHHLTHQRRVVLRELRRWCLLRDEDIREAIKTEYPEMGLLTVYRTLGLMHELGIVSRKDLAEGYYRYQLRTGENTHHARCVECGRVAEFNEELMDYLALQLRRDTGFVADKPELTLHGRCGSCTPDHPR